jgi:hypothetical protein
VTPVECEGAPRDLGRDQGVALRTELVAALGAGPLRRLADALGLGDAATRRLDRDLRRHFPHQSEWLAGLARGAGVTEFALLRALRDRCAGAGPRFGVAARCGDEVRVACGALPGAVLRRTRPEGRFRSLELTFPEGSSALIGVNEVGLAALALLAPTLAARCAAPSLLFARDCLERFERVDPALEWCLSRPAARGGSLLLADSQGELAAVDHSGPRPKLVRPTDELLILGAREGARGEVAKRFEDRRPTTVTELEDALDASFEADAKDSGPALLVDPSGRRLRQPGADWLAV